MSTIINSLFCFKIKKKKTFKKFYYFIIIVSNFHNIDVLIGAKFCKTKCDKGVKLVVNQNWMNKLHMNDIISPPQISPNERDVVSIL